MKAKGIIHCHSTYSYDGKLSLRELRGFLLAQDIQFCALSEHTDHFDKNKLPQFLDECRSLSDNQFIFIPGFEVPYKNSHILLLGTEVFLAQTADSVILKNWVKETKLTALAHPVRNHFIVDEVMFDVIQGIEIWNQQYDGKIVPRTRSLKLFSKLKKNKPRLLAMGGLDFHRTEHFGAPLYELEVNELSREAVLGALLDGRYTFQSSSLWVSSDGSFSGQTSFMKTKSAFSTVFIGLGKWVNRILGHVGIRPPKKLVESIRAKI